MNITIPRETFDQMLEALEVLNNLDADINFLNTNELEEMMDKALSAAKAVDHMPDAGKMVQPLDLQDRLVAISSAVADGDDRAAQSMLSETLKLLAVQPQAQGDLICFMSPDQLQLIQDPEDVSGKYIPLRKTSAGKFTMALYAHPQASEPQAQADRKSWLIEITAGAIAPAWLCGPDMRIGWTKNANAAISFPSNEVAEEVFARLMDKPRWRSLGFDKSCYAITEHLFVDAHPQSSEPVWRDIATAPKDGTAILGCWPSYIGGEAIITGCQYVGRSWVTVDYMHLEIAEPIYWMPLPAAPEATK